MKGLGVSVNKGSTNDFPIAEYVGTQAAAADPTLDDRGCCKRLAAQSVAQKHAWLAKLHAPQPHSANRELYIHKIVQPYAPSNKVSTRQRQVRNSRIFSAEKFNLLRFDQRKVLPRMLTDPKVPVANNAASTQAGSSRARISSSWLGRICGSSSKARCRTMVISSCEITPS